MVDDESLVLKIERVFPADPEQLFAAWTEPEKLVAWWGPEGMATPVCEMDVKQGGSWLTTMRNDKGDEYTVSGIYRLIEPPTRLVFTWAWHDSGERNEQETEVILLFDAVEGGTRLRLEQRTFIDRESRDSHRGGWLSSFKDLARLLGAPGQG